MFVMGPFGDKQFPSTRYQETVIAILAQAVDGEAVLHLLRPMAFKAAGASIPWRGIAWLPCSLACHWPLLLARPEASVEHAAVASGWRLGAASVTSVGLYDVYVCGGWTSGRLSSTSTSTWLACGYWSSASGAVACLLRCEPVSGVCEVLHLHRRRRAACSWLGR